MLAVFTELAIGLALPSGWVVVLLLVVVVVWLYCALFRATRLNIGWRGIQFEAQPTTLPTRPKPSTPAKTKRAKKVKV